MTRTTYTRLIDLTWALLLGATLVLWLTFDQAGDGLSAAALMAIMLIKSALIGAVFMDLWRASKLALALLLGTMATIGGAILLLG